MAKGTSKNVKALRDPFLFPRPTKFEDSGHLDWLVNTCATQTASNEWMDQGTINDQATMVHSESPRDPDDWDTLAQPKTVEQLAREKKMMMDAEMERDLQGWPWPDGSREPKTIAPYCLNEYAPYDVLKLSPHSQSGSHLMRFMDVGGIRQMMIDLLFMDHSTIWKFAFTCQKALHIVNCTIRIWDMTTLNFNGCELDPAATVGAQGTVSANLVIAYLRGPSRRLMEKNLYEIQLYSTYQLCKTVQWRGFHFRRLHLHRVPFLTVEILQLTVPHMVNLEMLGVYKCPLIHIGHAMKLLEIIQLDRMKGRENQVYLDFYPRFHVGPVLEVGNPRTIGGFGATWEDWQGPTDRAIWAIVFRFAIQCARQGIDAFSTHTQFRKWLEDGPCYDVANTLAAMNEAFHFDQIRPGQGRHALYMVKKRRKFHFDGRRIEDYEFFDLYPDLTRAIVMIDQRNVYHRGNFKRFFTFDEYKRPEGIEWMYFKFKCTICDTVMPGVFFHYPDVKRYNEETDNGTNTSKPHDIPCLGCRLRYDLDHEVDHFKREKNKIMEKWTSDFINTEKENVVNTTDLGKLIDVFESRHMMNDAINLDAARAQHREERGYDRENEELQAAVTEQVKRSRRGAFLGAPKIDDWKREVAARAAIQDDPTLNQWHSYNETRHLLHSRHYG